MFSYYEPEDYCFILQEKRGMLIFDIRYSTQPITRYVGKTYMSNGHIFKQFYGGFAYMDRFGNEQQVLFTKESQVTSVHMDLYLDVFCKDERKRYVMC